MESQTACRMSREVDAAFDPVTAIGLVNDPALTQITCEAKQRLHRATEGV